jgi:hypothetical protein
MEPIAPMPCILAATRLTVPHRKVGMAEESGMKRPMVSSVTPAPCETDSYYKTGTDANGGRPGNCEGSVITVP